VRAAVTIFLKDLRLRSRDRSVFLFAIVVPLALTVVFSLVFPDTEDFRLTAAVIDRDGSDVSRGFADGVVASLVDDGVVELHDAADEDAARAAMTDGDLDAVWVLPAGFGDAVTAGRSATLQVLVNPDRPLAAEVARGIGQGYASRLDQAALAAVTAQQAAGRELSPADVAAVGNRAAATDPPLTLTEIVAEDRQLDPVSYLAAGMAVFFLFFTVQYGVAGMLEERQQGTLPRLLAAPIGAWAVHAGKTLGAFALGVVSMTVLAIGSTLLLDAHWGHPLGVAILVVTGVAAALGVMTLVASFAHTAEQAGNLQAIVALVLGLLGGVFFPVGRGLLGQLSLASPHAWFLRGLGDLVGTGRPTAVLPAAAAITAFGLVTGAAGALRLRRVRP
jgi:ABC-2 type transport system permease protein